MRSLPVSNTSWCVFLYVEEVRSLTQCFTVGERGERRE